MITQNHFSDSTKFYLSTSMSNSEEPVLCGRLVMIMFILLFVTYLQLIHMMVDIYYLMLQLTMRKTSFTMPVYRHGVKFRTKSNKSLHLVVSTADTKNISLILLTITATPTADITRTDNNNNNNKNRYNDYNNTNNTITNNNSNQH